MLNGWEFRGGNLGGGNLGGGNLGGGDRHFPLLRGFNGSRQGFF